MTKTGTLIAIEGIDGSGKSTLALLIQRELKGEPPLLTQEPGATELGAKLRAILQEKTVPVCSRAEFLLFAANRAQHFEELIKPALAQGRIVISDRMDASSLAYQGYGRGLDLDTLRTINSWAMCGLKADLTIYVRVSPDIAHERIKQRNMALTAFEKEKKDFMHAVARGYDTLFAQRDDVLILDGTQSMQALTEQALHAIQQLITQGASR